MVKTPADKWNVTVADYKKKCQAILETSKDVRYAGVINSYGRTLAGFIRPGIKPKLAREDAKNEFFIVPALISMRKDASESLGKMEYVLLQHHNISILALQKDSVTYYISINKKADSEKIVSKIHKII